ncbi:putative sporulation protein YtxC [Bacillus coahuilensis]|uniref:putative sporulation protein YtxC n=1 Tax=Bacillus coahuilensis TaxID=408580 RepID=UPI000185087A|nr:putative sporulation protein YtxC [Bacillus coahuilensis]
MVKLICKQKKDGERLFYRFLSYHISTSLQETLVRNQPHYIVTVEDFEKNRALFSRVIKEYMMTDMRRAFAASILTKTFYFEDEDEIAQIVQIVEDMGHGEREELVKLLPRFNEAYYMIQSIEEVLESGGTEWFSFDSFLTFRMQKYYQHIVKMVELAIDEFKMEQEYQTYIHSLREYVKEKRALKQIVHLVKKDLSLLFYDEHYNVMEQEILRKYLDKRLLTQHPVYIDSSTIAPLLSLAPKEIHVYLPSEEDGIIRTIKNIFEERIQIHPIENWSIHARGKSLDLLS